jgi:hypothetical protein
MGSREGGEGREGYTGIQESGVVGLLRFDGHGKGGTTSTVK